MVSPEDIKRKIKQFKQSVASRISPEEKKEVEEKTKAVTKKAVGEGEKGSVFARLKNIEERVKKGTFKRRHRAVAKPGAFKKKKRQKKRLLRA